jgi:hypothetical protein
MGSRKLHVYDVYKRSGPEWRFQLASIRGKY